MVSHGGKNCQKVTTTILRNLLKKELAQELCWAGSERKRSFKDLTLNACITRKITSMYK